MNKQKKWTTVKLPKVMADVVRKMVYEIGYRSVAEYVRAATRKQLDEDLAKYGDLEE